MPFLTSNFAGIPLENPFIIAASPCSRDANHIIEAEKNGWSGAVIKSVTAHPPYTKNPRPSLSAIKNEGNIIGITSNEIYTDIIIDQWCQREIPKIKANTSDKFILIGSVMEGPNPSHWGETCDMLEKAGVDAIELNVSCPHGMSQKHMGKFIQDDANLLHLVMKACKESVKVPIVVKLNALCINSQEVIHSCKKAKIDGITATNSLLSIPSVDIRNAIPNPANNGFSTFSGYCGPGIRPIALGFIAEIAQQTNIPISGVGGIENWINVIEFIMLGASSVQLCSSVMINGYEIILQMMKNIQNFLISEGYNSIEDIVGVALNNILSSQEIINHITNATASIDLEKCSLCGLCVHSCDNGGKKAISIIDKKIIINKDKCVGCGLCSVVCPINAIVIN